MWGSRCRIVVTLAMIQDRLLPERRGLHRVEERFAIVAMLSPRVSDCQRGRCDGASPSAIVHRIVSTGCSVHRFCRNQAQHVVVDTLSVLPEQVAYLLNIRGDDVAHCPVVMAYALVTSDGRASLFINQSKLSLEVASEMKV